MMHVAARANGASALKYQWMKSSRPLAREMDHVLIPENVTSAAGGAYFRVVSDECGDVRNSAHTKISQNWR